MKPSLQRLQHLFLPSLLFVVGTAPSVSSFSPASIPILRNARSLFSPELVHPWRLHAQSDEGGETLDDAGVFGVGLWKLPNDFQFFLNQCAIQSLMFLINYLKDRHTALWLEDFTSPIIRKRTKDKKQDKVLSNMAKALQDATRATQMEKNIQLLTYHGLGALNTTMFPTWESYFERLLQEPGVTYLIESSRPLVPTYELDINPASLCSRLISVREQIAREFVRDLDVIADMSGNMMNSYYERMKEQKGDDEGQVDFEHTNLLFLEMSVDSDYAPSPLRKGNFDLLVSLTTQESIHRVLNDGSAREDDSPDKSSIQFLRNFYAQRIGSHFTGSNWYGRADNFLEELLSSPPRVVQLQDEQCGLVDPIRVVELILKEREKVALEWLELSLDVPKSHTDIKRWQLNKLMGYDTTADNSFQ